MMPVAEDDLRIFADLGTDFKVESAPDGITIFRFEMAAQKATISIPSSGCPIKFSLGGHEITFSNSRALLASEHFGDLRRWASNQAAVLELSAKTHPIPIEGEFSWRDTPTPPQMIRLDEFDEYLSQSTRDELRVFVIDGPAGIGKTTQISQLARTRARNFATKQEPLLLHVESTGRVLQNLDDLIAGSLQKIRAQPTFDQLRVLVKHGLVTLAIDGFDELTDPNGYQLAWSQLGGLLEDVRGCGQVILSGRETFVSMSRMVAALPILTRQTVSVAQYRLREVDPQSAKAWLLENGLTREALEDERIKDLLSAGSYGLRPFFLSTLVDADILSGLPHNPSVDLLAVLVEALITREQNKFGDDVAQKISRTVLGNYVRNLCEEIARDMADNQSEVLPGQSVMWVAELCLPVGIDRDLGKTLIHRAGVMPFLTNDKDRNSVRFSHRQYLVFFLSSNAIKTIARPEIPKYIRRNILGSEFLETFPKVLLNLPGQLVLKFRDEALLQLPELNTMDRSSGNVASLLLACCCDYPPDKTVSLRHVSIDEVYLRGEVPSMELTGVTISILHAERTDLTALRFCGENTIVSLQVDDLTCFPPDFPVPLWLEDNGRTLRDRAQIIERINGSAAKKELPTKYLPFDPTLLNRILRYRPFWLRDDLEDAEPAGKRIVGHADWHRALQWLEREDLVRVDERFGASGRPAKFIHFRIPEICEKVLESDESP
jgi:hypothetical protein